MSSINLTNQTVVGLTSGDVLILPSTSTTGNKQVSIEVSGTATLRPSSGEQIDSVAGDKTVTSGNYLLSTTGGVNATWVTLQGETGGGGTPGGSDKQVQYNNAGAFGGISNGTAGHVLTSNGAGSAPSFQAAAGGGASISVNNQTPVSSGTAYIPIPQQPFVPISAVTQPMPPANSPKLASALSVLNGSYDVACLTVAPDQTIWAVLNGSPTALKNFSQSGTLLNSVTLTNNSSVCCIGPDHELWLQGGTKVTKIKISDGSFTETVYTLPASAGGGNMVSDGTYLWIASNASSKRIYRIATDGTITTCTGTNGQYPYTVTAAPNGGVWCVTAYNNGGPGQADYLMRCTAAGTITETTITDTNETGPILTGPDGNVYVTILGDGSGGYTNGHAYVLKYDQSATLLGTVDLGVISSINYGSLWASDGYMYVTNNAGNKTFKIATDLTFTTLNFCINNRGMAAIAAAPDGGVITSKASLLQKWENINAISSIVTTVAGSTSGNLYWSMPEKGASYKKVVVSLASFNDAGTTITFPTAFSYTPSYFVGAGNVPVTPTSVSTTQLVLPSTGGASTGTIIVEGF